MGRHPSTNQGLTTQRPTGPQTDQQPAISLAETWPWPSRASKMSTRPVRRNRSLEHWPEPFPVGRGGRGDHDTLVSRSANNAGDLTEGVMSDLGHIVVDNA